MRSTITSCARKHARASPSINPVHERKRKFTNDGNESGAAEPNGRTPQFARPQAPPGRAMTVPPTAGLPADPSREAGTVATDPV